MKQLLLFVFIVLNLIAHSQENKTVTLVVSGQGKTQDEAKQNALRSAIEQAFGAFISSKTEILNDKLIKDEIVSVANGNIQKYEIISEVQIPNGDYATTLKATVSVTKLTSFVESKGEVIEFKGKLFAFNINQQILNETNEAKAIKEITKITMDILRKSLYGIIQPQNPILKSGDTYSLPFEIEIHTNNNINDAVKYFTDNLNNLSLTKEEISNYRELNKQIYEIILVAPEKPIDGKFSYKNDKNYYCPIAIPSHSNSTYDFYSIYLRNKTSYDLLNTFVLEAIVEIFQFKIETGILTLKIDEIDKKECNDGYMYVLANGLVPFSSPNEVIQELPIIYPESDYLCVGSSLNNESFPTINKSLARYFCKRRNTQENRIPFLVILLHEYINGGLVYQIKGRSNVTLNDINQISSIQIIY